MVQLTHEVLMIDNSLIYRPLPIPPPTHTHTHTHCCPDTLFSTPTHFPDLSSGLEGGLGEVGIDVLHMLLTHLLQGSEEETGMSRESVETFVETLRRGRESSDNRTCFSLP